jgi:hypothetical protein
MALSGNDGYFYVATLSSVETTAPALSSESWYKIMGKSSTGGSLPTNLSSGDVFYQITSNIPVTTAAFTSNDAVNKMTLTKAAFVTDVPVSASREKFDDTVQTDEVRSYQVSSKPEKTGTINGFWLLDDSDQLSFVKQFGTVMEATTTGGITKTEPETAAIHTFLSRDETTDGSKQVWEYMPIVVDTYNADKPMEGPQTFSVNYTLDGKERPNTYILDNS